MISRSIILIYTSRFGISARSHIYKFLLENLNKGKEEGFIPE